MPKKFCDLLCLSVNNNFYITSEKYLLNKVNKLKVLNDNKQLINDSIFSAEEVNKKLHYHYLQLKQIACIMLILTN